MARLLLFFQLLHPAAAEPQARTDRPEPADRPELADRIVSVVGGRPLTRSDLDFERSFARHDAGALGWLVEEPLDRLEDQAILRAQAGDLPLYRPGARELEARLDAFRRSWPSSEAYLAFLARWGLDDASLRGRLVSRMIVEAWLRRNLGIPVLRPASPEPFRERYEAAMESLRASSSTRRIPPHPPR